MAKEDDSKKSDKKEGDEGDDDKKKEEDDEKGKEGEEEEGEEDGEEIEEETEDAEPKDENDPSQYSPEAQDWAVRVLGDRMYAKYYDLAAGRTDEDAVEMLRRRKWRAVIKNIRFTNMGNPNDLFLSFSFGWNFRISRRLLRIKGNPAAAGGATNAPPDPKAQAKNQQWVWVKRGTVGKVNLTKVVKNVGKGVTAEFYDSFAFDWTGSYFDLFRKSLHVEVWDWNQYSPNKYLAQYERTLRDLVSDSIDQTWKIFTSVRKRGKTELVAVGELSFQLIFQEILDYTIKLSNWSATVNPWIFLNEIEEGDESVDVVPFAVFNLHTPVHLPWSRARTVSKALKLQVSYGQRWLKINFGELPNLKFRGTRTELEDGVLYVDVFDKGVLPLAKEVIGRAVIPLKSVAETGTLSSQLTLQKSTSSVLQGLFGPRSRALAVIASSAAMDAVEASGKMATRMTGRTRAKKSTSLLGLDDEEMMMQGGTTGGGELGRASGFVGGSVNVDVLVTSSIVDKIFNFAPQTARLWREFAQVGEPNPPDLRDHPPYNYSYLCVRVIQARNLMAADESGLSDPFVTVAWGDQRLKTRIVMESLDPVWNEEMHFLVRSFDPSRVKPHELASQPSIDFLVWDYDPSGSSEMLGSTRVLLHEITGCGLKPKPVAKDLPLSATTTTTTTTTTVPLAGSSSTMKTPLLNNNNNTSTGEGHGEGEEEDEDDDGWIPTRPTKRVVIKRRRHPAAPLVPVTIETRVFKADLPLEGLPPGLNSTLSIEMYFRTPVGDLKEMDPKIRARTGTDLLVVPPLGKVRAQLTTTCLCEPVMRLERIPGTGRLERRMCLGASRGIRFTPPPSVTTRGGANDALTTNRPTTLPEGEGICVQLRAFNEALKTIAPPKVRELLDLFCAHTDIDLRSFCAKDQFGDRHWLPTFLHPIHPPRPMIFPEELPYLILRSSQKPNSCFLAAQMVRAVAFSDLSELPATTIDSRTWLSPDFFLTMKKGDVKAHVLLLCNVFLGLMTDAYVCLGFARTEPTREAILEVREKARELKWDSARRRAEFEKLRGEPRPYVWLMTRESTSELYGPSNNKYPKDRFGGAVKFWDVAKGAYYPPLPNRWEGQNDEELYRAALNPITKKRARKGGVSSGSSGGGGGKKRNNNEDRGDRNKRGGEGETTTSGNVATAAAASARVELNEIERMELERLPDEEELLTEAPRTGGMALAANLSSSTMTMGGGFDDDVAVDVNDVFAQGAGTGDMWGESTEPRYDEEAVEELLGGGGATSSNGTSSVSAHTGGVVATSGASPSSTVDPEEAERQAVERARREFLEARDGKGSPATQDARRLAKQKHGDRTRFVLGHKQRQREARIRERLPFTKILAVFNDKNVWVNIQKHTGTADVTFDMQWGIDAGWLPCLKEEDATHVQPFYPARNLGPRLTEDKVSELRRRIQDELEAGLENLRSSYNVSTRFAGRDMNALVRRLVEARHEAETIDKTSGNGWDPIKRGWIPGSEGFARTALYNALRRTLLRSVPPGFTYRIGLAKFNTTDPVEVRKIMLEHEWSTTNFGQGGTKAPNSATTTTTTSGTGGGGKPPLPPSSSVNGAWAEEVLKGKDRDPINEMAKISIHEENHAGREMFAISACVFPFYNQTTLVRVAVVVVFPKPV